MCTVAPSLSLSFSFVSVSVIRAPSPSQPLQVFSLPGQFSIAPAFHNMAAFLPPVVQFCSLNPQTDFMFVQNDFIFIHLCLKDKEVQGLPTPSPS